VGGELVGVGGGGVGQEVKKKKSVYLYYNLILRIRALKGLRKLMEEKKEGRRPLFYYAPVLSERERKGEGKKGRFVSNSSSVPTPGARFRQKKRKLGGGKK